MKNYIELGKKILEQGCDKDDRTGTGTKALFGEQLRFDLSKGFPAVTTKKLAFKTMIGELLWFLSGDTTLEGLQDKTFPNLPVEERRLKRTIWHDNYNSDSWQGSEFNQWKYKNCELSHLGRIYGVNWRSYPQLVNIMNEYVTCETISEEFMIGFDQISWLLNEIKTNPNSRKMIVLSFHPEQYKYSALSSCHTKFQVQVMNGKLNLMFDQSSSDYFLGLPINLASYALLTHMLALECDLEVGELICNIGDAHIYNNHIEQVNELISREPFPLPTLRIKEKKNFFEYSVDDFELVDYNHHPEIKAKMAV